MREGGLSRAEGVSIARLCVRTAAVAYVETKLQPFIDSQVDGGD
jgi:hypothetical protein